DAAVREFLEETGLEVRIVDCLGWVFIEPAAWPGPIIQIMYEAEIIGGELRGSSEGAAGIFFVEEFPPICKHRTGSQKAMQAYLAKVGG
ncbi:MAG: NUDIX hydrolase, partial [Dehalococcoidia bacterium]